MSKLRAPLRELLDDSLDEVRLRRMWREVSQAPLRRRRAGWVAVAALALCAAAIVGALRLGSAGPLAADGGGELLLDRPQIALSDGSRIEISTQTALALVENSGRAFGLRLLRGRARFEVTPGGPRRWRIECGLADVLVVGTGFTIDRGPASLRVEVDHGVVEVRGPRVAGGLQRLAAGQVLEVGEAPGSMSAEQLSAAGVDHSASTGPAVGALTGAPPLAADRDAVLDESPIASRTPAASRSVVVESKQARAGGVGAPRARRYAADASASSDSARPQGAAAAVRSDEELSRVEIVLVPAAADGLVAAAVGGGDVLVRDVVEPGAAAAVREEERSGAEPGSGLQPAAQGAGDVVAAAAGGVRTREDEAARKPRTAADARGGAGQSLLEEADRARLAGSDAHALLLLQRVMRERAGTKEAALAGFTFARMQMRERPAEAADALRASLAAGAPDSLREDVLARLVEAYVRAGKHELAARAAADYRLQYPGGRRSSEVEHWARGL